MAFSFSLNLRSILVVTFALFFFSSSSSLHVLATTTSNDQPQQQSTFSHLTISSSNSQHHHQQSLLHKDDHELASLRYELSKTRRMTERAKRVGRKRKERVFGEREERLKERVEQLEKEMECEDGGGKEKTKNSTVESTSRTTFKASQPITKSQTTTTTKHQVATSPTTKNQKPHTDTTIKSKTTKIVPTTTSKPIFTKTQTTSTQTTKTTIATSKSTSNSSNEKKKKGLGFNRIIDLSPFLSSSSSKSSVEWVYNWTSDLDDDVNETPLDEFDDGVEFVPMLWKPDQDHLKSWKKDVRRWIKRGSTHLLGFNEPDLDSQAHMTVSEAIDGWKFHLEPFHESDGMKLVSPAVTNGGAPLGISWLEDFMSQAKQQKLHVDAIALHWYDSPTNVVYFKNYLKEAHDKFGLPIWLTEYGFSSGTEAEKIKFHQTVVPWMDKQPWIERYAAFGANTGGTFVDASKLLPLGTAYNSA